MTQSAIVSANVEGTRYDIIICRGLLGAVGELLAKLSRSKKAAVITDSHVGPLYADKLAASLRKAGIEPIVATIPAGEDHKTLAHISPVFDALLDAKIERTTPVLALGGGMIGDMAGFVAAIAVFTRRCRSCRSSHHPASPRGGCQRPAGRRESITPPRKI